MKDFDLRFNIEQIRENLKNASKEQNPVILAHLVKAEFEKLETYNFQRIMKAIDVFYKKNHGGKGC